jgi:hypothetical protein
VQVAIFDEEDDLRVPMWQIKKPKKMQGVPLSFYQINYFFRLLLHKYLSIHCALLFREFVGYRHSVR